MALSVPDGLHRACWPTVPAPSEVFGLHSFVLNIDTELKMTPTTTRAHEILL